ncbi:NAD(P)/FAD-dependent oxidoreductase [Myxococcota bacterium]|nr:NAD(P)/FAD-dependent oxidoreductase [Myxococcota bacterium]
MSAVEVTGTSGAQAWPTLFSPLVVGACTLPNRIVMPAMDPSLADAQGHVTPAYHHHFLERVLGGAGLVVTGNVAVTPRGRLSPWMAMLADDEAIPGFARLCADVRTAGGHLFIQLSHAGRQTVSQFAGGQPVSASAIPCPVMRDPPRALEEDEIEATIDAFASAAARAQLAGAHGVELHMAHGYLVCQFLSPYSNHRTDAWGGDEAGRVRFATEIVRRIRARVGADFVVQCRLSADERVDGGITPPLCARQAEALVHAGADVISVSACNYESYRYNMPAYYLPEATYADLAAGVRTHLRSVGLTTPVVAVGRFRRPSLAESVLASGGADLIAFGRALIADAALPRKLATGAGARVRPCVACNRCAESVTQGPLRCLVNPEAGTPPAAPTAPPTRRRILVVGGGPAGIMAALEASRRGHRVELHDSASVAGGKVRASALPPEKQAFGELASWLAAELADSAVEVHLGSTLSPEAVRAHPADAVIVAVGAVPAPPPPIPGVGDVVATVHPVDALESPTPHRHIVVLGGGPEGCEVADALAARPEHPRVTLVEQRPKVGLGLPSSVRWLLQERLAAAGIHVFTQRTLARCTASEVALTDRRGRPAEVLPAADLIVLAVGVRAPTTWGVLRDDPRVTFVGDADSPATILEAVAAGYKLGRSI